LEQQWKSDHGFYTGTLAMRHQLKLHEQLSGYRVEGFLQAGGMGEVYRVTNLDLEREEALKLLKPELCHNPDFVLRFLAEARRAAQLEHAHIIPIYRIVQEPERIFFTMKLIEGRSLSELIHEEGALPEEMVLDILAQVTRALEYAHSRGVVHRDIKPANIMLDRFAHAYLLDFGIAKNLLGASHLTQTGTQMGTALYMSPEQAQDAKKADERSDLYSLGVLMFQMLTGELPFQGESEIAVALKHIQEAPPDPKLLKPDLSPECRGIVLKLLTKSPDQRYQTARELILAMRRDTKPLTEIASYDTGKLPQTTDLHETSQLKLPNEAPIQETKKMKLPVYLMVGFLALMLLGGTGMIYWDYQEKQEKVTVKINSHPINAKIKLGDKALKTGEEVVFRSGDYTLEISLQNFDTYKEKLTLKRGQNRLEKSISLIFSKAAIKALLIKADKLYASGHHNASIETFQQVLDKDPKQNEARKNLINIFINRAGEWRDKEKFQECLDNVEQALKYSPNRKNQLDQPQKEYLADLLNSVAYAWRSSKKDKAISLLKMAIELNPTDLYKNNLNQLK